MRILLTNDDGFGSVGIKALDDVLSKAGHEVWVCAPSEHKSSTSHSLSFTNGKSPVEIQKNRYSFDGQPADCIMASLGRKAIDCEPDVVISGINAGYNLSIDILYSGTCGAASEASLWGYKAIAISAEASDDSSIYYKAANFLAGHLDDFLSTIDTDCILNINMPLSSDGKTWSVGRSFSLVHRDAAFPNDKGVLLNGKRDIERGIEDSDLALCAKGLISVTPISVSPMIPKVNVDKLDLMLASSNNN